MYILYRRQTTSQTFYTTSPEVNGAAYGSEINEHTVQYSSVHCIVLYSVQYTYKNKNVRTYRQLKTFYIIDQDRALKKLIKMEICSKIIQHFLFHE